MNDKGKIIRSFILGFLLGGALVYTGVHFCRTYMRGHSFWGRGRGVDSTRDLDKLNRKLDLSAEQKILVEKILESELPKMKKLRETMRPQLSAARETIRTQIRAVLNQEQLGKYDKMIDEFEARRKKREEKRGQDK